MHGAYYNEHDPQAAADVVMAFCQAAGVEWCEVAKIGEDQ